MKIAFFDSHLFDKHAFQKENQNNFENKSEKNEKHHITFFETRLTEQSAQLANGFPCICAFVNDHLDRNTLKIVSANGTRLIALRSAGFNHVDLKAAEEFGLKIVRVPEYSPHAVAEYAVALMLTLNRKIYKAYNRVREGNFSLDGLVGFDLYQKSVGIIGVGKIGAVLAKILRGFECQVFAYDLKQDQKLFELGVQYVSLEDLMKNSDIISLHVPLTPKTHHLIDEKAILLTKPGVMIINTGRGALIDTKALIQFLKSGHIGYAGLDVYEEEEGIFFENFSGKILQDDQLSRLLTLPNVLLTSHQAFLTQEALSNIAQTTLQNISDFEAGLNLDNEVCASKNLKK